MKNIAKTVSNWQFNTKERIRRYLEYDDALSGGVYSVKDPDVTDCEFDIDKVLGKER